MFVKFLKTLYFIASHPAVKRGKIKAVCRYISWQLFSRMNIEEVIFKWIDDAVLKMRRSEAMVTHNFYTGLYEYEDFIFFMRYADKGELFFDIGANAGVYTVLAAKVLDLDVVAFEPVNCTFERLKDNLHINGIEKKVLAKNIGLSDSVGTLNFTNNLDATNHVALNPNRSLLVESVRVSTLDNEIDELAKIPTIIKIDVEGFELMVFRGAERLLSAKNLRVIIVELNDSGEKFGYKDSDVSKLLSDRGFFPCDFDVLSRTLNPIKTFKSDRQNTIFVRDIAEINLKLKTNNNNFHSNILKKNI